MCHSLGNRACSAVGQVAIQAAHPLFQERRVSRLRQQVGVVVAFQQQRVAACQMSQQMGCCVAQIGQHTQLCCAICAGQLQGLAGVVRHCERHDLQISQCDGLPVACSLQQTIEVGRTDAFAGAPAHPHRNPVAQRKLARAADVVTVFVGDEDRVNRVFCQARFGQAG